MPSVYCAYRCSARLADRRRTVTHDHERRRHKQAYILAKASTTFSVALKNCCMCDHVYMKLHKLLSQSQKCKRREFDTRRAFACKGNSNSMPGRG
eukprot:6211422-Pleurochrysis_carterae.AAC.1